MRQCEKCGYLLPASWDTCKRCGAAVGAPAQPAPATVGASTGSAPGWTAAAAPEPSSTSTAAIGGGYDPRYSAPVRIGSAAGTDSATEATTGVARGNRHRRPRRRPPKPFSRIVALVVVGVLVSAGWFWFHKPTSPALPHEAEAYLDGQGVTYAPFNEGYSVRLPVEPQIKTETVPVVGGSVTVSGALVSDNDRYEMVAMSIPLATPIPAAEIDARIQTMAQTPTVGPADAEIESVERVDFEGRPAAEASLSWDDYEARMLFVIEDARIIIIGSHATDKNDALFETLKDSLEITS